MYNRPCRRSIQIYYFQVHCIQYQSRISVKWLCLPVQIIEIIPGIIAIPHGSHAVFLLTIWLPIICSPAPNGPESSERNRRIIYVHCACPLSFESPWHARGYIIALLRYGYTRWVADTPVYTAEWQIIKKVRGIQHNHCEGPHVTIKTS